MIRLIACDLDGTLMDEEQRIAPAVREAIAEAQAAGITVTLASGRMFTALLPAARDLAITAPLICYQGGWIQAPDEATPRFRATLAAAVASDLLRSADKLGWHAVLYADGRIFLREQRHPPTFYTALLGSDWQIVASWESVIARHQVDKVLFVASPEGIPAIAEALRAHVGTRATVVRSHARFVEVIPPGVNKGEGLRRVAEMLGVRREAVMAIGDQENDLPMIVWAGVGVAMGNAVPALKAAADFVAPPLWEEGAAVAIRRALSEAGR